MDFFFKLVIAVCLVFVLGDAKPALTDVKDVEDEGSFEDLLKKVNESEAWLPEVLSKDLTFVHDYNDTKVEGQEASSKFSLPGGLANKIQNMGGVQKTILNNRVQYNFYFWLLPKNFSRSSWEKH